VSGLVGYLMSLPWVRKDLHLDDKKQILRWSTNMKERVVLLATEARETAKGVDASKIVAKGNLLTAYNGVVNRICSRKRDDIPGDPFLRTVCIQAPQCLEECQLSIALGLRCLLVAVINFVWLILNQHCHIRIIIFNFDTEWN
jgi:hypothetical protein